MAHKQTVSLEVAFFLPKLTAAPFFIAREGNSYSVRLDIQNSGLYEHSHDVDHPCEVLMFQEFLRRSTHKEFEKKGHYLVAKMAKKEGEKSAKGLLQILETMGFLVNKGEIREPGTPPPPTRSSGWNR